MDLWRCRATAGSNTGEGNALFAVPDIPILISLVPSQALPPAHAYAFEYKNLVRSYACASGEPGSSLASQTLTLVA